MVHYLETQEPEAAKWQCAKMSVCVCARADCNITLARVLTEAARLGSW